MLKFAESTCYNRHRHINSASYQKSSVLPNADNAGTLAVTAQAPALAWGRWADQPSQNDYYMMNISGLIQPRTYDPRATSSAALTRAIMAPQYSNIPYTTVSTGGMTATQQHQRQHSLFAESPYGVSGPAGLGSAFGSNYIQQRPQVRMVDPATDNRLPYIVIL